MKKLLFLIVMMAFIIGLSAFASDTRVTTMGNVNNTVKDEANIWLYPHTITSYPKLFTAEYSSGSDFSMIGVHRQMKDDDDAPVCGFYFYENSPILFGATNQPTMGGSTLPNRRISAFYGTQLGGRPFGVALNYTQASQESEASGDATKRSNFKLDGTVSSIFNENLEVATSLSIWNFDDVDAAGADVVATSGNLLYKLYGRYWLNPNDKFQRVLHGAVSLMTQTIGTTEESDMSVDLGFGCNYQSSEDVLVVSDFGIMYLSEKTTIPTGTTTNTNIVLPYFRAGIDAKLFKWMDFRAGVESFWNSQKIENSAKYSYVNTNTYLGAGFHWGNLEIDAQLQPSFLTNGPYFVSGSSDDLATRVSVNYWFE